MYSERDASQASGGRRSAASADGNFVREVETQRRDLAILRFEDLAIGRDNEVVLHTSADLCVAAFGRNEEVWGALGAQAEVEIKGEGSGVEGRAKVGGGRWQRQAQRAV